jgi:hypothetical protein
MLVLVIHLEEEQEHRPRYVEQIRQGQEVLRHSQVIPYGNVQLHFLVELGEQLHVHDERAPLRQALR